MVVLARLVVVSSISVSDISSPAKLKEKDMMGCR